MKKLEELGFAVEVLPVWWLGWLEEQACSFLKKRDRDPFSVDTVKNYYDFSLPESFEAKSIILAVMPGRAVPVHFQIGEEDMTVLLPPTYSNTLSGMAAGELTLKETLEPQGLHVALAPTIPMKPLVAASGMGCYGRNNLVYRKDEGSYFGIAAYYSDLPCGEEDRKPAVRRMELCENCRICVRCCPTEAIPEEGVICAGKCITYFNEIWQDDFPQWLPEGVHRCFFGCMECQRDCPANKDYMKLMQGRLGAQEPYYDNVARNVKAAIETKRKRAGSGL